MQLVILAGLMLVSWLLRPKPEEQHTYGPRLDDLKVSSSTFGTPLPILYGTCRMSGILIDSGDLIEHAHTEEQEAGKGGGGGSSSYTWYSYTCSFAMAFCTATSTNPVAGITKIWAGSDLIYDMTGASAIKKIEGLQITKYLGTETQDADSTLESIHGAGQVPAYRGVAYVMFKDMDLTDYGNAIPSITAEVCSSVTNIYSSRRLDSSGRVGDANKIVVDNARPYLYFLDGDRLYKYDLSNTSERTPSNIEDDVYDIFDIDRNGNIYISIFINVFEGWSLVKINADGMHDVVSWTESSGYAIQDMSCGYTQWGMWSLGNRVSTSGNTFVCPNVTSLIHCVSTDDGELQWTFNYGIYGEFKQLVALSSNEVWAVWNDGSHSHLLMINKEAELVYNSDISAYITYAIYITYDETNDCLLVGSALGASNGRIIKVDRATRSVTATLDGVVGAFNYKTFKNGPRFGKLIIPHGTYAREIDIETMTVSQSWAASLWGLSSFDGGVYHDQTESLIVNEIGSGLYQCYMFRATGDHADLDDVVTDICTRRDSWMSDEQLGTSDIDVTGLVGNIVPGYIVSNQMSRRQAIEPLMTGWQFEACLEDNKIVFTTLGQAYIDVIPESDLAAHETSEEMPEPLMISQDHELELPCQVSVTYLNPHKEYEQSTQYSRRLVSSSQKVHTVNLSVVWTDDVAARIAERLLFMFWTARYKHQFALSRKYMYLSPTDVVYVTQDSNQYRLRIAKIDYGMPGLLPIEAVEDNALDVESSATGAPASVTVQTVNFIGPTRPYLLDCPILRDQDNDSGFYVAANGYTTSWNGCVLYRSTDSGISYTAFMGLAVGVVTGSAITALPTGPVTIFDEGNYVDIVIFNNEDLYSATEANVLNGSNAALLGDDDRWEVIQWKTATLTDSTSNIYRLSGLLRGRRGTDWAIDEHVIGDRFILLQENYSIQRKDFGSSDIGSARLYKAVTRMNTVQSAIEYSFTNAGVGLKPYSPVHITGTADGSGNITITWIRRTRIGGEWRDYVDVPLGETSEAYKVEIMSGSTVIRTISSLTSATCTYTAAQQVTDFGSTQSRLTIKVYQYSETVGYGYPGEETFYVTEYLTGSASKSPSKSPSASPSKSPSASPSVSPSLSPSLSPSVSPSESPSTSPSVDIPGESASESPSASPSVSPSESPSSSPSESPSESPSLSPSVSESPSESPSVSPSVSPSSSPSVSPSLSPSESPSASPSALPPYRMAVTVPTTSIGADLTDFPLYVNLADLGASFWSNLAYLDGRDIRVTNSSDVEIPFDLLHCDRTAQTGALFTKITLNNTSDTTVYVVYGTTGFSKVASTAPNGRNAVWSDYQNVYFFTGNDAYEDHTGSGYNLASYGQSGCFVPTALSGDLNDDQGIAYDGTYYYVTDNNSITKYDSSWNVIATNADPCGDVGGTANRCGDPEVVSGVLYVPTEYYLNSTTFSEMKIAKFSTTDLSYISSTDISAQSHEARALCYVSDDSMIYVASYTDGSKLWKYNISDLSYAGYTSLSSTISSIKGITYWDSAFWINSDVASLKKTRRVSYAGTVGPTTSYTTLTDTNTWNGLSHSDSNLIALYGDGYVSRLDRVSVEAGTGVRFPGTTATETNRLKATVGTRTTTWTLGASLILNSKSQSRVVVSYSRDGAFGSERSSILYYVTTDQFSLWNQTDGHLYSAASPALSTLYRFHAVHSGTSERKLYTNASAVTDTGCSNQPSSAISPRLYIGVGNEDTTQYMNGDVGFVYLRASALSADWISAEVSNLHDPSSFYTVGSQESEFASWSMSPSSSPSLSPSASISPSSSPSLSPSASMSPSRSPSRSPSESPSASPSVSPS